MEFDDLSKTKFSKKHSDNLNTENLLKKYLGPPTSEEYEEPFEEKTNMFLVSLMSALFIVVFTFVSSTDFFNNLLKFQNESTKMFVKYLIIFIVVLSVLFINNYV